MRDMSRSFQLTSLATALALALCSAGPALAGIGDSALPSFPDGKASLPILKVPGVVSRTGVATVFLCSSIGSVPIDVGVEVFDEAGSLQNDVHAGVGAVLAVAPGATVTFTTNSTAAFLESAIIPVSPSFTQGSARVLATSPAVKCNVLLTGNATTPPTSLSTLSAGVPASIGAVPSSIVLPTFSDGKPATDAVLFAGVVKKLSMETAVFCTSTAATPIDIGVEILAVNGTVANDVHAGSGGVVGVAPGQTVTFGTSGTVALLETSVIVLPSIDQGVARVVSTSTDVLCTAASLDASAAPPAAMSNLYGRSTAAAASGPTLPTPLPSFSDGKPAVHVATVPGVMKRGQWQTLFVCDSLASVPVDIGVQVFAGDGTLLNDIAANVGAVLDVAPGATVTLATSTTAAYSESAVIPLATGLQGVGRIVASSNQVQCTTLVVDDAVTPPASLSTLAAGVQPVAGGTLAAADLPTFPNADPATHSLIFPGAVKRGNVETDIFCTSLANVPIDIGVQFFASNGSVVNDVGAGNGALTGVAPGTTVTFGTTGTAALFETQVVTLTAVAQGMARVVSNSPDLLCSAMVLDAATAPPSTATALAGFTGGCGDGILQAGEQCEATSDAACPGNCGSDCLCPPVCGDGFVQTGEACDDSNTTAGDCCSATCQLECDDGNPCTKDSCNPAGGICANDATPSNGCLVAAKSIFQIKSGTTAAKDRLKWKWNNGPSVSQAGLGHPDTTTGYALCVYDSTGGAGSVAAWMQIAPSPQWIDRSPSGWSYVDPLAAADGVITVSLRSGTDGRSKVQIKAGGLNLPMPVPVSASQMFDAQPAVTVQLSNGETSTCWQSVFTTPLLNDGLRFKAKSP